MDGSIAESPIHVAPLIPLPAQQAKAADDKEDLYSILFSPPTPRASPTHTPEPSNSRATRHARNESVDSEFGAFVSVPATEDPLRIDKTPEPTPFSPLHNYEFFDKFTEDARAASDRKRREVLDELLLHEDDPLYFLQGTNTMASSTPPLPPSVQATTPLSQPSPLEVSLIDLNSPSETQSSHAFVQTAPNLDISSNGVTGGSTFSSMPEGLLADVDHIFDDTERERESRHRAHTGPGHSPTASHFRSPSLPPSSPTRLSSPEIQHTQPSYFTPPSFPSLWVSNLLTSTIRAPRTGTTTPLHQPSASSLFSVDPEEASSSSVPVFSRSAPHSRAATVTGGVLPDVPITHGTPFASHIFVPPSGAPGFTGDTKWNKGFEYDKTQVERKSVRLTERKEVTSPVLTVELADMLRPFFPALARLPKTWSLLYSLDQHGISLNTLYARCQEFKGSALIVVRDAGEAVFGAYMGEGIHPSKGAYYGSGESFLWRKNTTDSVDVYKWTGKNDYVALCEPEYFSFGGGDGHYGLWIDDTLTDGSSARCPTFDNDPLCSAGKRQGETVTFECVGLEVWGIG